MATFSFGDLIADIRGSAASYEDAQKRADDIRQRMGSLVSRAWETQASLLKWRPDPNRMPGIDRIELLCNQRCGTDVQLDSLFRLRGELCLKRGVTLAEANILSLNDFATGLEEETEAVPLKRKQRGRPKADYKTTIREAQLKAKWEQARGKLRKRDFCEDHGLDKDEFDKLLDRVYQRQKASE